MTQGPSGTDFNRLLEQFKGDSELSRQITNLGLTPQPLEKHSLDARKHLLFQFQRRPTGSVPALEVVVDMSEYGYHVMVNSLPYDPKYHRSTGSPIRKEEVVEQMKVYLSEVTGQPSQ